MGSQIAVEYALAGHDVTVLARDSAKASQRLASAWQTAEGMERWPDDAFETGGRNLVIASDLETVDPPDLALESIVEDARAGHAFSQGDPGVQYLLHQHRHAG
jgi:3-hydroxyacyl-CoA dehydrogenase